MMQDKSILEGYDKNELEVIDLSYQVSKQLIGNNRSGEYLAPQGVIFHSTASPGATAQNIRDYFNGGNRDASATYTTDWNTAIMMIPENEVAWHAGPTANHVFIGIELCEVAQGVTASDANFQTSIKIIAWLIADIFNRYGWGIDDTITVKGKQVPRLMTHHMSSTAFGETDHTDPDPYFSRVGYSWNQALTEIKAAYAAIKQPTVTGKFDVYQYAKLLKEFTTDQDAIAYSKQWDHSRVLRVDTEYPNVIWNNFPVQDVNSPGQKALALLKTAGVISSVHEDWQFVCSAEYAAVMTGILKHLGIAVQAQGQNDWGVEVIDKLHAYGITVNGKPGTLVTWGETARMTARLIVIATNQTQTVDDMTFLVNNKIITNAHNVSDPLYWSELAVVGTRVLDLIAANKTTPMPNIAKNSIMGQNTATAAQMVGFVKAQNPNFDPAIAEAFLSVGAKYGVRGDVAFCQSIIETNFFRFGGDVKAAQNNFAGIGATGNGNPGLSFPTIEAGVTAQIQHLFAYASTEPLPAGEALYDPRFNLVTRGIAKGWEDLAGRWAIPGYDATKYKSLADAMVAGASYGQAIMKVFGELTSFVVPQPTPQPTPVVVKTPFQELQELGFIPTGVTEGTQVTWDLVSAVLLNILNHK